MTQPHSGSKKGVGCAVALGALVVILVFGIINSSRSDDAFETSGCNQWRKTG